MRCRHLTLLLFYFLNRKPLLVVSFRILFQIPRGNYGSIIATRQISGVSLFRVMGIAGLLRWTDSVHTDGHISLFKGKRLAVDLLCWIHKAIHGCGISIVVEKNIHPLVTRLWYRIKEIKDFGITLVLVLDGADMPIKAEVDSQRQARRDSSFKDANIAFEKGRPT